MNPIGLDLGGANLKASDGKTAVTRPFPLWREPDRLSDALKKLLELYPAGAPLAVTMTGELADCFETRAMGVSRILDAVDLAGQGRTISVWQTGGEFVSTADARYLPELVAAANWHALATWAGRMCPEGVSLLMDIGSTTTDIIPIENGLPATGGLTDRQRLTTGELLYLGVERTPVPCLSDHVMLNGVRVGLAREVFATTLDLHLVLGERPDEPENRDTANGGPATLHAARIRLARQICSDLDETSDAEILEIARFLRVRQQELVLQALGSAWPFSVPPKSVLTSGAGEFLAVRTLTSMGSPWSQVERLSLRQMLGPQRSSAACAEALSHLAAERLREPGF